MTKTLNTCLGWIVAICLIGAVSSDMAPVAMLFIAAAIVALPSYGLAAWLLSMARTPSPKDN